EGHIYAGKREYYVAAIMKTYTLIKRVGGGFNESSRRSRGSWQVGSSRSPDTTARSEPGAYQNSRKRALLYGCPHYGRSAPHPISAYAGARAGGRDCGTRRRRQDAADRRPRRRALGTSRMWPV